MLSKNQRRRAGIYACMRGPGIPESPRAGKVPFQGFPSCWQSSVRLLLHPGARFPFSLPSPTPTKHSVFPVWPLTIILTIT